MIMNYDRIKTFRAKMTPQRLAIMEYLEGNTDHPSVEDVYNAVRDRFPTISLATVYNTLSLFKGGGMLRELSVDPLRKRYDPDTGEHYHIICKKCGAVHDIRLAFELSVPQEGLGGYRITDSHLYFDGLCPVCDEDKGGKE